ncbi:hypothetical protein IP92_03528 [Pseudoduganella flava]|uniref:Uncharacterized protein n=1 Tax=Pseudoduganella flava TaxID=871742 RepID=A0A562PNR7_9BURK|nr:hypothetical protein [Pseudoduganella flava]QGZ40643.1 hypothetical protein GO485_17295 [Pseudoduganella flava]TWI46095.1 hypothetical protein IP92_03528 [Pseudoduganella flava]
MNIAKHMETIFVAALVLIGATSMATAAVTKLQHRDSGAIVATADGQVAVVKVTAKRLSAAEKAAL